MSASPSGTPITELIKEGFEGIGYSIFHDLKNAVVNAADFGVPQNRNRVIIVGLNNDYYEDPRKALTRFYNEFLPELKVKKHRTVAEAIGDLPKLLPYLDTYPFKPHSTRYYEHIGSECLHAGHCFSAKMADAAS